jgi:uncharacterized membrane protein YccC
MSRFRRRTGHHEAEPVRADRTHALEFDLNSARKQIGRLEQELDRARREADGARAASGIGAIDAIAEEIATPLAHLATQVALLRTGTGQLETSDLIATAERLVDSLSNGGIRLDGSVGDTAAFDPSAHLPLRGEFSPGHRVIIRSPAVIGPSGRIVRQAVVESV